MFKTVFRFLASLHLALFLLTVLIVACAIGTIYESRVNAEVARHWVYNAPWFNAWLVLLVTNLFCAAAIRYPWKPHQTGFVITHAGIILLLIGGMIDRKWGVEGYVGLTVGDAPSDTMNLREQEMLVFRPTGAGSGEPARTPLKVDYLANTRDPRVSVASGDPGIQVEVLGAVPVRGFMSDYEAVRAMDLPDQHATPGVRWTFFGEMMGGAHPGSILLNDRISLGPATLHFRRGLPPEAAPKTVAGSDEKAAHTEVQFVFANHPDMPTVKQLAGPATGAKAALAVDAKGEHPVLKVTMRGKDFEIPVRENLEKHYELEGLEGPWHLRIVGYYHDFIIVDGKKTNRSAESKNPAVEFQLVGPPVEKSATPAPDAQAGDPHGGGASGREGFGDPSLNVMTLYLGDDGKLRYHLKSRKSGEKNGEVVIGQALETGFAKGATFTVDEFLPRSVARTNYKEIPPEQAADDESQQYVLRCRVAAGGEDQTVLVPPSHDPKRLAPADVEVGGQRVLLTFSSITQKIPFTVALMRFHAPREQGSDMFRTFESNLCFDDRYDRVTLKADAQDLPAIREHLGEFLEDRTLKCAVVAENPADLTLATANGAEFRLPRNQVSDVVRNTRKIYMNNPTSYPEVWWGPWTGTTYKFSQSGFEKGRSDFSTVQVLRDPGWLPKWVGSLMICFGIFTMFYLKPYFRRAPAARPVAAAVAAEPTISKASAPAGIATASASKETNA
ncbi:MAG: cytochrome c biogenesis protein ResB [Planctomycetes bacterium]|nr:cytochrome c biogenesis protein ResB [Planctomycetota bacterium]